MKNKARYEFDEPESCSVCDMRAVTAPYCKINDIFVGCHTNRRHPDCPLKIIPETPKGKLKPCPFCGAQVSMVVIGFYFAVHCRCCYKTIVIEVEPLEGEMNLLTKDDAIAAWNRREG